MKTGYLIDMDGVIYRENQLVAGAVEFVEALIASGTPFIFLTNNSAPTPEDLSVRLRHLGLPGLSARHFYTSALNTADFLSETHPGCTVFVIGEGGLLAALHEHKIANDALQPSYVVVGEGAASMETDIRGAIESGLHAYLVLTGSTQLESVGEYVYQPTRVLQSVADLTEEIRSGQPSSRLDSPVFRHSAAQRSRWGNRHQTDGEHPQKPRPRAPMTR